jgi:hypothetical protein
MTEERDVQKKNEKTPLLSGTSPILFCTKHNKLMEDADSKARKENTKNLPAEKNSLGKTNFFMLATPYWFLFAFFYAVNSGTLIIAANQVCREATNQKNCNVSVGVSALFGGVSFAFVLIALLSWRHIHKQTINQALDQQVAKQYQG